MRPGILLLALCLTAGCDNAANLPSPPTNINTLHYKWVEQPTHAGKTWESIVDTDWQRTRVEITGREGLTRSLTLLIQVYDPAKQEVTEWDLHPNSRTGTRKVYPSSAKQLTTISSFMQEFYPGSWQRVMDFPQSGMRGSKVRRVGTDFVGSEMVELYEWMAPTGRTGYRWWMKRAGTQWIPVQYARLPKDLPDQILELRINQPLDDKLFVVTSDYQITEARGGPPRDPFRPR